MKNFKLVCLMAMAGIFLFLGGCQKEEDEFNKKISDKSNVELFLHSEAFIKSHFSINPQLVSNNRNIHINEIKNYFLQLENSNSGTITKIVTEYGIPFWDFTLKSSENIDVQFSYYIPLFRTGNSLTDGYIHVVKNKNSKFIINVYNSNYFYELWNADKDDDRILPMVSVLHYFNLELFNSSYVYFAGCIEYFENKQDIRIKPRTGCWDDVVEIRIDTEPGGFMYTSYYGDTNAETAHIRQNPNLPRYKYVPARTVARFIRVYKYDPDCYSSDLDVTNYFPAVNGGQSLAYSSYFAKVEKNLIFVNACMNNTQNIPVADDSHNNPAGESWLWSPEDVKKCTLIKQLSACGLSESYVAKYLSAYETGVFTEIVKNFSTNQFCGSPFLDDALYNYFLLVESQLSSVYLTSNVSFSSYINSYITIQTFLNSHNNDQISTQIGNHFLNILNSNLSNPGSGNTLTLEYLNLLYLHETLKSNYPDYNSANVNIDVFIATYGAEKYIAATTLYTKMRMNGMNVSWIDIEARFQNWYIDNIDSGQEYSISGGFDWSKHSPVTSQSLPSYSGFFNAYPKQNGELLEGAANIFNLLNGPIRDLFDDYPNLRNVCALKVSIALNGAGVDIPFIFQDDNSNSIKEVSESSFTIPDDNGNYYFLNAELLIKYMLEVFPTPSVTVNGDDLQNGATPETSFGLNNGIYGMLPLDVNYFGASGHCDIWLPKSGSSPVYNECGAGCHWGFVDVAYLWILN